MLDPLISARDAVHHGAWDDAFTSLSRADRTCPLGADDLELLAMSAFLTGRDRQYLDILARAHHAHLTANDRARAARSAFWLALTCLLRGEDGAASGWLSRGNALLPSRDCVERGYLLLPAAERLLADGDSTAAHDAASAAGDCGCRFGDRDLMACARHLQGRALIHAGQTRAGLTLLDEAMVTLLAGELSPLMTGLVYCSVIEACLRVYALNRAREWTAALSRWCEQKPQMVAFTSTCLVYRAEILQLQGAWENAMAEARRACERSSQAHRKPSGAAIYQQGEIHRVRGDYAAAAEAYHSASLHGYEPQPGLALLRSAQGQTDSACTSIQRLLASATDRLRRAGLLAAGIEIMLAAGDVDGADRACPELEEIAAVVDTDALRAMAAQCRGAVELGKGNATAALVTLRRALQAWQRLDAPYAAARVRVLVGLACRSFGDAESAALEFSAAGLAFRELSAAPDLAQLDALQQDRAPAGTPKLTTRERQVLRMIAAGGTNRAIAHELSLSERTVDRHVSNILTKLDVPSRAAAAAYACSRKLF
jgi:ATP/maltotriose-dependent transcriptional regulator MalT